MNNEIKEILDRLERIDHKEYSCGFEFADSGSFDEDCRCFEERKKMANYITNLQQENTQLKIQLLEKKCSDKDIEYKEKIKLQQRIDKAIEYINHFSKESEVKIYRLPKCKVFIGDIEELLEILKGGNDEKSNNISS